MAGGGGLRGWKKTVTFSLWTPSGMPISCLKPRPRAGNHSPPSRSVLHPTRSVFHPTPARMRANTHAGARAGGSSRPPSWALGALEHEVESRKRNLAPGSREVYMKLVPAVKKKGRKRGGGRRQWTLGTDFSVKTARGVGSKRGRGRWAWHQPGFTSLLLALSPDTPDS